MYFNTFNEGYQNVSIVGLLEDLPFILFIISKYSKLSRSWNLTSVYSDLDQNLGLGSDLNLETKQT